MAIEIRDRKLKAEWRFGDVVLHIMFQTKSFPQTCMQYKRLRSGRYLWYHALGYFFGLWGDGIDNEKPKAHMQIVLSHLSTAKLKRLFSVRSMWYSLQT